MSTGQTRRQGVSLLDVTIASSDQAGTWQGPGPCAMWRGMSAKDECMSDNQSKQAKFFSNEGMGKKTWIITNALNFLNAFQSR